MTDMLERAGPMVFVQMICRTVLDWLRVVSFESEQAQAILDLRLHRLTGLRLKSFSKSMVRF